MLGAVEVSMSCEKSDNTQASKEPLEHGTPYAEKITEMDSHSAFSKRVRTKDKMQGCKSEFLFAKWFKALTISDLRNTKLKNNLTTLLKELKNQKNKNSKKCNFSETNG